MAASYLKDQMARIHGICDSQKRGVDKLGGGMFTYVVSFWVPWWRKATEEKQPKVMVEEISSAARVRRQQESGRRGRSEGGYE